MGKNNISNLTFKPRHGSLTPKSPGMKYRHYSPKAAVFLVEGNTSNVEPKVQEIAAKHMRQGYKVGIMTINEAHQYEADKIKFMGHDLETIARNIFKTFRTFDKEDMDVIIMEGVKEEQLGLAIMNRIRKAAKKTIRV